MHRLNVNYKVLEEHVEFLIEKDLIEEKIVEKGRIVYAITSRGMTVLKGLNELQQVARALQTGLMVVTGATAERTATGSLSQQQDQLMQKLITASLAQQHDQLMQKLITKIKDLNYTIQKVSETMQKVSETTRQRVALEAQAAE